MSGWTARQMAQRAARDIRPGAIVNLGIGLPELVAEFVPAERGVMFHSENGILGMGPRPGPAAIDDELINAGKNPVTLVAGGSYFHHADSFAMIRGGHIDLCIMGAFEVSCGGDLANWDSGAAGPPAVGGAMDLAIGARRVHVLMTHVTKSGMPKLVQACRLPLTGRGVVRRIYTDLAVIDVAADGFHLVELASGVSREAVAAATGAPLADGPGRSNEAASNHQGSTAR